MDGDPIPRRFSPYSADPLDYFMDPLIDIGLEEQVLSSMLQGARIDSLEPHHFTSRQRRDLYTLLRASTPYEEMDSRLKDMGWDYHERSYLTDVYFAASIPRGPALRDAISDLKRLHLMRRFCADVDNWRKGAPFMEWSRALRELSEVIRKQGLDAANELRKPADTLLPEAPPSLSTVPCPSP